MKLHKISERIYYSDYDVERDRPILGYIKGDHFSVAVDAGHSDSHLNEFYALLKQHDLPLPEVTVITHWHWDHSFAMHAVNGLTIANEKTDEYLRDFIRNRSPEYDWKFLNMDPSIALEYAGQKKIIVVPADITFHDSMTIDTGSITIKLFTAVSPHTDDATLVEIPEEKVLFFGDALSGVFPTWIADPVKKDQLISTIEMLDVDTCIGGHWDPWNNKQDLFQYFSSDF